jgi:hypothetical protein
MLRRSLLAVLILILLVTVQGLLVGEPNSFERKWEKAYRRCMRECEEDNRVLYQEVVFKQDCSGDCGRQWGIHDLAAHDIGSDDSDVEEVNDVPSEFVDETSSDPDIDAKAMTFDNGEEEDLLDDLSLDELALVLEDRIQAIENGRVPRTRSQPPEMVSGVEVRSPAKERKKTTEAIPPKRPSTTTTSTSTTMKKTRTTTRTATPKAKSPAFVESVAPIRSPYSQMTLDDIQHPFRRNVAPLHDDTPPPLQEDLLEEIQEEEEAFSMHASEAEELEEAIPTPLVEDKDKVKVKVKQELQELRVQENPMDPPFEGWRHFAHHYAVGPLWVVGNLSQEMCVSMIIPKTLSTLCFMPRDALPITERHNHIGVLLTDWNSWQAQAQRPGKVWQWGVRTLIVDHQPREEVEAMLMHVPHLSLLVWVATAASDTMVAAPTLSGWCLQRWFLRAATDAIYVYEPCEMNSSSSDYRNAATVPVRWHRKPLTMLQSAACSSNAICEIKSRGDGSNMYYWSDTGINVAFQREVDNVWQLL